MDETTLAIGVFDGVHRGHRQLVAAARHVADQRGGDLVAVSFDPHPAAVLHPERFEGLLTLPGRRADLLRTCGADRVEYLTFDEELRDMEPQDFAWTILRERLRATAVVVGHNFTFGRKAAGTAMTLEQMGAELGFAVTAVDLVGDGVTWSSTRARHAVLAGDVATATRILGRPHRLTGEVVHGDHRGRELGYPTANLGDVGALIVPADGVYSAVVTVDGQVHPAAVSIGTNPTFVGVQGRRIEAHVLDRHDLDLYGATLDVDFLAHIRGMEAFGGVDELLAAMARDIEQTRVHAADFVASQHHW